MNDTISKLESLIHDRRGASPSSSYVALLFANGREKIAQKLGEEAVETVIASLSGDSLKLTNEAADLVFHLLVLLADGGVAFEDVVRELDRREGVSGITEKALRDEVNHAN